MGGRVGEVRVVAHETEPEALQVDLDQRVLDAPAAVPTGGSLGGPRRARSNHSGVEPAISDDSDLTVGPDVDADLGPARPEDTKPHIPRYIAKS